MTSGTMHKERPHCGGEGGFDNCQILRTNSTDRLREMRTNKGGGGVENPENFADVLYVWSLSLLVLQNIAFISPEVRGDERMRT